MANGTELRGIALEILLEITQEKEYSHLAIRNALNKVQYLPKQDRAFINRLVEGTLEYMLRIDYVLNQFSSVRVNKMKPVIRNILRSGVYQLMFMDSVPDPAACNEAVKLAQKKGFYSLKGFVNGVMRNIARNLDQIKLPDADKEPEKYLSVRYSVPEWIVARFIRQYGKEACEKSLEAFLQPHPTSVQVDTDRISMEEITASLQAQGITVTQNPEIKRALFLSGYEALDEIEEFENGLLYVQDTASMLAVEMAAPKPGDTVIDVCAAPGGKSVYAARMIGETGHVESRDLTEYKVAMIEDNIERCQLSNMTAKVWDATEFDASAEEKADVVIADLPCSGLGVIGTKTDIKYNASEEKIQELAALQQEILQVVCRYVKPDGTLLYSTCTMTKEENEENVHKFLETHTEFELEQMRQCFPYEGCDGFFMAKMHRK